MFSLDLDLAEHLYVFALGLPLKEQIGLILYQRP
jgi:hypothetical protein